VAGLNRRMGQIESSEVNSDGSGFTFVVEVPLSGMFGYSTELKNTRIKVRMKAIAYVLQANTCWFWSL